MNDKKCNSKSIRISDKVLNYINAYRGNGFNEKFENIILDAMESEDDRIKTLKMYDNQIERQKQRYFKMCDQLSRLEPMVQSYVRVYDRIRELNRIFDICISEMSPVSPDLQKK